MLTLLVRCQGAVMKMISPLGIQVDCSWTHKGGITSRLVQLDHMMVLRLLGTMRKDRLVVVVVVVVAC